MSENSHEDVDTHIMVREPRFEQVRVEERDDSQSASDAADTIETGALTLPAPAAPRAPSALTALAFEGLADTIARPRRERPAVTTLPGLQEMRVAAPVAPPAPPSNEVGSTQPFDRRVLAGHATVFEQMASIIVHENPTPLPAPAPEPSVLEPRIETTQPPSIAPFAVDLSPTSLEPATQERVGREAKATVKIRPPSLAASLAGKKLIAGGAALATGALVAFAALRHHVVPARSAAAGGAGAAAESSQVVALPGAAEVAPAPLPEIAPAPVLVPATGTIAVRGARATLLVDGERKKVQDGRVVVACGKHRVGANRAARMVYVPCGGTVTR